MMTLRKIFPVGHLVVSLLFVISAAALIVFAALQLWHGINPLHEDPLSLRLNAVLEAIAVLTVAIAALELGETVIEEQVQREAQMSAPTRIRRFLSRFMIVLVVSLSIESLVAVFQFIHEDPAQLPNAAVVGLMAAALLAAWGVFVKLNRSAEELEPQSMQRVTEEDARVEKKK